MNRTIVWLGVLIALLPLGCRPEARSDRPNIVLILTDDQEARSLPQMRTVQERIADRGMTFSNAFVTTPLCCPSRASILTGLYAHNHGVIANRPPEGGAPRYLALGHEQRSLPVWLKAAGYRTALIGKYLNSYDDAKHVPPGWDAWTVPVGLGGYQGFDYVLSENGRAVRRGHEDEDFLTDVLADAAVAFIRDAERDDRRPFFLYFAPISPHSPWAYARRDRRAFREMRGPRPPSFDEADARDKPTYVQRQARETPEIQGIDRMYRRYLRSLKGVDHAVALILDVLEDEDERRDTYVFFASDNGVFLGEHRQIGKAAPYEEAIHVPFVVTGPGVAEGRVSPAFVLNLDLAPTFLEIARISAPAPPEVFDGRSILALLRGKPAPGWRRDFLFENLEGTTGHGVPRRPTDPPPYRGVRTDRYKYVELEEEGKRERELYDLSKDPYELENLDARPESAPLIERLAARLRELSKCQGNSCR